jgi:hypothetical protein
VTGASLPPRIGEVRSMSLCGSVVSAEVNLVTSTWCGEVQPGSHARPGDVVMLDESTYPATLRVVKPHG